MKYRRFDSDDSRGFPGTNGLARGLEATMVCGIHGAWGRWRPPSVRVISKTPADGAWAWRGRGGTRTWESDIRLLLAPGHEPFPSRWARVEMRGEAEVILVQMGYRAGRPPYRGPLDSQMSV